MKTLFLLLSFAIIICLPSSTKAQIDSSSFDLGSSYIKKEFAHHITIKGEELEKMPFSSLQEVISVYMPGFNPEKTMMTYIIDGIHANNADAYSIYDIESISLIMDARTQLITFGMGLSKNAHAVTVVITTKIHTRHSKGLSIAGGSYLVQRNFSNKESTSYSTPDFFHQYHIAAQHKTKHVRFGISANMLRHVEPLNNIDSAASQKADPFRLNRFRLNGWVAWKPGKNHELLAQVNYVPQKEKSEEQIYYEGNTPYKLSEVYSRMDNSMNILLPSVQLRSALSKNWSNFLSASFFFSKVTGAFNNFTRMNGMQESGSLNVIDDIIKNRTFQIREHITYHKQFNNIALDAAVDAQFVHVYNEYASASLQAFGFPNGFEPGGSLTNLNQAINNTATIKGSYFAVTPALSAAYKSGLYITGGVRRMVPTKGDQKNIKRSYPFVATTVNPLAFFYPKSTVKLSLFGSYSEMLPAIVPMPGLSVRDMFLRVQGNEHLTQFLNNDNTNYDTWQTGAVIRLFQEKLSLDYNWSNSKQDYFFTYPLPPTSNPNGGSFAGKNLAARAVTQHVGLSGIVVSDSTFNWRTGMSISSVKTALSPAAINTVNFYYDVYQDKPNWSGGWHNHFTCRKFTAGFNLQYIFNELVYTNTFLVMNANLSSYNNTISSRWVNGNGDRGNPVFISSSSLSYRQLNKVNTFLLQHLYVGMKLKKIPLGEVEIYLSGRNLWQNKKESYSVNSLDKYYGVGMKWANW